MSWFNGTKGKIWAHFRKAKKLWEEDECAPDAEQYEAAWLRLFGVKFDQSTILMMVEYGDCVLKIHSHPDKNVEDKYVYLLIAFDTDVIKVDE
jgi:hypothetical protein